MKKSIFAFVGMPGAGKTEAQIYLEKKGFLFLRFGEITDRLVQAKGLPLTPGNERTAREALRKELGMAAYAIRSLPKINELLKKQDIIVIDGIYSWEEYIYLTEQGLNVTLFHIFAEPEKRYLRLGLRRVRPLTKEEARKRDIQEIESLNKGGPIAMADYLIDNNEDDLKNLHHKIDTLLSRLNIY